MSKKGLREVEIKGKRVFVRVDFNVPIDEQGRVADDTRIRAVMPTIEHLLAGGAAVILASHLGRPKGKRDERFSLRPVVRRLEELLGREVRFSGEAVGPEAEAAAGRLVPGDVLLLENVRFYPGEEQNDPELALKQASLADLYVNDAFGAAHRAHASTVGIAAHLPAVAGFLMEKELETLGRLLSNPERPFVAVIGGAKISGKIGVLERLLQKADLLLIGGGMANTLLAARGYDLQASLVETDKLDVAWKLFEKAGADKRLVLPVDLVVAPDRERPDERATVPVDQVPEGWAAFDIGPATRGLFEEKLRSARTVFWNGPVGLFEVPGFGGGTLGLARTIATLDGTSVIGGGDTVAALKQAGLIEQMTHVSTGGGASLELLEGRELPGVAALQDRATEDHRSLTTDDRRPTTIIVGNWKMYKTPSAAVEFVRQFREAASLPGWQTGGMDGVEIVIAPPYPALVPVAEALAGSPIGLAAQNMFWDVEGAFTGEVSPAMLAEIGCRYVILGHSERRQYFGETDAGVNRKVRAALAHRLIPIVCVGESPTEREGGLTEKVVTTQIMGCLADLSGTEVAGMIVAYEPVWAIGTGRTASPEDAQVACAHIRALIESLFGAEAATRVRVQYGGSVKPDNARELMSRPDIDGALVGGASLKVESFAGIIRECQEATGD